MNPPTLCRPEAYFLFARSVANIHSCAGLLQAATAVSMHALDDVEPQFVDRRIQQLADRVNRHVQRRSASARLAHLHAVLFDEEQFRGDATRYYNPLNSYLPAVLETRQGIPLTLALVYKLVAERVGLEVEGVNAPGHFLVRVRDGDGWLLVDPFHGGAVLSPAEAFGLMEKVLGRAIGNHPSFLASATHPQWVARMLANLESIFEREGCRDDRAAMQELQLLLMPLLAPPPAEGRLREAG